MKNILLYIILILGCITMSTACCSEEDEIVVDNNIFLGEWVSLYNSSDNMEVTDLTLSNSFTVKGMTYEHVESQPIICDRISGGWVYSPTNRILGMILYHSATGIEKSESYIVNKIDTYSMILQEQETSMLQTFLKVLQSENLQLGRSLKLSSIGLPDDFKVERMETSCSDIVSVESKDQLTANSKGIAFITLHTTLAKAIIKIQVQ